MRHQDSHGLRSGTPIHGPLLRKLYLKKTHAPQSYGSSTSKRQNMEATNREINTCMDNSMWYLHTRGRHKAIQRGGKNAIGGNTEGPREEPGKPSQSDRGRPILYASLLGGSSKFIHSNSLRKETPTEKRHTLKTHLVFRPEKPQIS